jgi:hypothetical protein
MSKVGMAITAMIRRTKGERKKGEKMKINEKEQLLQHNNTHSECIQTLLPF